jgi:hypothetical protein
MQITAKPQDYSTASTTTPAPEAPATATAAAAAAGSPSADASASAVVSLSPQGQALAASGGKPAALSLPDLEGIAKLDQALAGVSDASPAQARAQAQLKREQDKLKSKFSMLDVDAFRNIRAKLQQRPEPTTEQKKADEATFKQRIEDGKPLL